MLYGGRCHRRECDWAGATGPCIRGLADAHNGVATTSIPLLEISASRTDRGWVHTSCRSHLLERFHYVESASCSLDRERHSTHVVEWPRLSIPPLSGVDALSPAG